jgi:hypothetical protein
VHFGMIFTVSCDEARRWDFMLNHEERFTQLCMLVPLRNNNGRLNVNITFLGVNKFLLSHNGQRDVDDYWISRNVKYCIR